MATLPSPRTWTVGELLTAAKLNTDLRDGLNYLLAPPLAVLRKSANQSAGSGASVFITWDLEDIDRDGGHSTVSNTSRYTAQTAGWYQIAATCRWTNSGTDIRDYYINKNSSSSRIRFGAEGNTVSYTAVATIQMAVGDFVEYEVVQWSGSTINVAGGAGSEATRFEIRWVSTN